MRKKQPKEYIRTEQYRLRMTDEEASKLDKLSVISGLTKADVIRKALVLYENELRIHY